MRNIKYFRQHIILEIISHILIYLSGIIPFVHVLIPDIKLQKKFFGFSSIHTFMYSFGTHLSLLLLTVSFLLIFFTSSENNINSYKKNLKISLIPPIISSVFFTSWVFIPNIDYDLLAYTMIGLGVAIVALFLTFQLVLYSKSLYFHRKEEIEENIRFRKLAKNTIEHLKKDVYRKQNEERMLERQRISSELHDSIIGKLFGVRLNLGFIEIRDKKQNENHHKFLGELQEIEQEIRDVSHTLNTNIDASGIGFEAIIEQLLKDKSSLGKFNYESFFDENIDWQSISETCKIDIYRIIQEAFQNIIKHAKAKNIILSFRKIDERLLIKITDDGIGISKSKKTNGIGMKNIMNRVKRLRGTLQIDSLSIKGTTLNIEIPYIKYEYI